MSNATFKWFRRILFWLFNHFVFLWGRKVSLRSHLLRSISGEKMRYNNRVQIWFQSSTVAAELLLCIRILHRPEMDLNDVVSSAFLHTFPFTSTDYSNSQPTPWCHGIYQRKEKREKKINKQRGNMLNILVGITLCFLNVCLFFFFFCRSKCFGIYSVIIYALILINQIWNTLRKYDCLPHFAVSRLLSIISKQFSLLLKKNTNFGPPPPRKGKVRSLSIFHISQQDNWEYNDTISLCLSYYRTT